MYISTQKHTHLSQAPFLLHPSHTSQWAGWAVIYKHWDKGWGIAECREEGHLEVVGVIGSVEGLMMWQGQGCKP